MKKLLYLCCVLLLGVSVSAQEVYNSSGRTEPSKRKSTESNKGFDVQRLVYGGGLGFYFGSVTSISIAPSVGYRITDNFAAGIVLGYNYQRYRNWGEVSNLYTSQKRPIHFNQSVYTGGLWVRYNIIYNLFAHTQFEMNNFVFRDYFNSSMNQYDEEGWPVFPKQQIAVPSLLLGLGYRQPIEGIGSFFIMASYDVLQNIPSNMRIDGQGNKYSISPYANTIDFRAGFFVGF